MPVTRHTAPYEFNFTIVNPTPITAACARWSTERANVATGAMSVVSQLTVNNAGDAENVSVENQSMLRKTMEIPQRPNNPKLTAMLTPFQCTRAKSVTDEFGVSALDYRLDMHVICYISNPAFGWLTPHQIVHTHRDLNFRTHNDGNPRIIRGGRRSIVWNLPAGPYPNGTITAWIGLWMVHQTSADDVSLSAGATMVATLNTLLLQF